MYFFVWAQKFPQDANLVAAALLMDGIFDEEFVQTVLKDYSWEEYRKMMTDYNPIDEDLSSWFMAVALMSMIFENSEDDESTSWMKLESMISTSHTNNFTFFLNKWIAFIDLYNILKIFLSGGESNGFKWLAFII